MKSLTASMQTHIAEEVTTLAACWRLTRTDGVEFYFTDHDVDLEVDGDTYKAETGYRRTAIENDASMAVDNLEIQGIFDSSQITEQDLRAGKYDYASVRVFLVNWQDPAAGKIKLRRGTLGEVQLTPNGVFKAEMRGSTQPLSQVIGEVYQPECRADLGDTRCNVPLQPDLRQDSTAYARGAFIRVATDTGATGQAQYENRIYECTQAGTSDASEPTFDTVVGNETTDGTAVFTARQAWTRHGVVDTVADRLTFTLTGAFDEARAVDDWFNGGALIFEDGDNEGAVVEIRDWSESTRTVTLFLPASYAITAGTLVRLYPGCDKRIETCINRFAISGSHLFDGGNVKNFRGEPFVPGQDHLLTYPDAQ